MKQVDLNSDLGEGTGNDEAIMPFISSANIACGYHAGDQATMEATIDLALKHNVSIGAHPGYNDKANFGRVPQQLSAAEVEQLTGEQILLMQQKVQTAGGQLRHVKPHGALYNQAAKDIELARGIARAIYKADKHLTFYGLANSVMEQAAEEIGLQFIPEVFADRAYTSQGQLVSRSEPGAVIEDTDKVRARVLDFALRQQVQTITGSLISLPCSTICLHGDNAKAVALAKSIHNALVENNIHVKSPNT